MPDVLYIRLGTGGDHAQEAIESGKLLFFSPEGLDEISLRGEWDAVFQYWLARAPNMGTATKHMNQAKYFFKADSEAFFVTFKAGQLYWCKPGDRPYRENGKLKRATINGWSNSSYGGTLLTSQKLSGNLLAVQGYQGAICRIREAEYFVRKVSDQEIPELAEYRRVELEYLSGTEKLVRKLVWQDFETLVDLVFSASGWRRTSQVGGTQKTVDIEMILPTTSETAFVQVKSRTSQNEFNHYRITFEQSTFQRMFFVYHSSDQVVVCQDQSIVVVGPEKLSEMVLEAGLGRWVRDKVI